MHDPKTLRFTILSALGLGLLAGAPLGCAEECRGGGEPEVECRAPSAARSGSFDENGCEIAEQVSNSCCNPAVTGPEFIDGQCCYGFCSGACCGRPLLCDGVPRVAEVVARDDWGAATGVVLEPVDDGSRAELERAWLADALLEHASIGSFARFVLDLLAFAAPADLVEAAVSAMADETRHARACFALASAYRGSPVGPGKLDLDGIGVSQSLVEAAVAAVREGCIEETVSALIADEQARVATVPEVRATLERIATDEARHAELAFRFVRFAIQRGGPEVRRAVAAAFAASYAAPASNRSDTRADASVLSAHGRLSTSSAARVRDRAFSEVIRPCAGALLSAENRDDGKYATVPNRKQPRVFA